MTEADIGVGEEFRASLQGLRDDYNRQIEHLRRAQQDVRDVDATARTRDGMVTVSVDSRGRVREVVFDPRVYQRLSPAKLSRTIMRLIDEASEDVAVRVKDLMAPLVPAGFSLDEALDERGEVDLAKILPAAPSLLGSESAHGPGPGR